MAQAVNALRETQGGWALVREAALVATVRYEVGGLMTCRPPGGAGCRDAGPSMPRAQRWSGSTSRPTARAGFRVFPERLAFATLTCAPWRWVLVAPSDLAPQGFVNVATGQTHPIVW